jgi:hypothetical protein
MLQAKTVGNKHTVRGKSENQEAKGEQVDTHHRTPRVSPQGSSTGRVDLRHYLREHVGLHAHKRLPR